MSSENALVDRSAKVAVENSALIQSFTDDPSNELEEHQVLRIDTTQAIRMESVAISSNWDEERVVRIEHAARKNLEPLSRNTTCVNTFLADEAHIQLAMLQLLCRLEIQGLERIQEDLVSPDRELKRRMRVTRFRTTRMNTASEVVALVVKFENLGVLHE